MTAPATDYPRHPIQPIVKDPRGVVRFKPNKIVQYLLDHGGINMNDIAILEFPRADQVQFAQLIGYSVSGFGDLPYVTDEDYEAAQTIAEGCEDPKDARIQVLTDKLIAVRAAMRHGVSMLYGIHQDDLMRQDDP